MKYASILLDCDGVILDSNRLKTKAFVDTLSDYPKDLVRDFVEYHQQYGGHSRFKKFEYFLSEMMGDFSEQTYQKLLTSFADNVVAGLNKASYTPGFLSFINLYREQAEIYVVSGGFQQELVDTFKLKNIHHYFKDILGCPTPKHEHVNNLMRVKEIPSPVLFIGDSQVDYEVTKGHPIDFIFLSQFSEFKGWEKYCDDHALVNFVNFQELLDADFIEN